MAFGNSKAKLTLKNLLEKKEENKNKKVSGNLKSVNGILYGVPDSGKSSLITALFENEHILLACENGCKSILHANDFPVATFTDLKEMTTVLATEEAYEQFGGVCIIDTLTRLGEILESYILNKYGKDTLASVMAYNGAYKIVDRLYAELFADMKKVGWSFWYICHSESETLVDEQGREYERFNMQTNKRLRKIVEKEADLVLFINKKGVGDGVVRTLYTNESKICFGKNKLSLPGQIPQTIGLKDDALESASIVKEFFAKSMEGYGDRLTKEVVKPSVEAYSSKERDIDEIKEEMIELGRQLTDLNLREQAIDLMNRSLGQTYEGEQRTIDMATQENAEALEIGIMKMKELLEKYNK